MPDANFLLDVLNSLPEALCVVDERLQVTFWNPCCERLFGWTAEAAIGQAIDALLSRTDGPLPSLGQHLAQVRDSGRPLDCSAQVRHCDGHTWRCRWRLQPTAGGDGRPAGVLGIALDADTEEFVHARASEVERILAEAGDEFAFVLMSADARIQTWNAQAQRLYGLNAEQAIGQPYSIFFDADEQAEGLPQRMLRLVQQEGRVEREGWRRRPDGSRFWCRVALFRLSDGRYARIAHDLSTRRQFEMRLLERQQTLAAVIDSASDAVLGVDPEGRITLFNPAAEQIFGYTAQAMLGRHAEVLVPVRHRDALNQRLRNFAGPQGSRSMRNGGRITGLRADGKELAIDAWFSRVQVHERIVVTAMLRDMTETERARREVLHYQRELSNLAQRLLEQEKTSSRRLAQALHDQVGQTLTALRLAYDATSVDKSGPMGRLIDQALLEVRQVLTDLRPPLLDELGLFAALRHEIENQPGLEQQALAVRLEVSEDAGSRRWPPDVEYAAFMIAREAIGNARQHSGARNLQVRLTTVGGLQLDVVDDGCGFDATSPGLHPGHLGLVGMRERAAAIGARFALQSGPEIGTRVSLHWKESP